VGQAARAEVPGARIFKDNAAGSVALAKGEVDVSQQFNSNIQVCGSTTACPSPPTCPSPLRHRRQPPDRLLQPESPGLDQVAVRKAIAMAVDYPTIIANAMTNQSATFDQVPRSLMNPTPVSRRCMTTKPSSRPAVGRQRHRRRQALLDEAGIVDTDGDGWREYNGQKLSYVATCPNGWSDWQAAIEVVAAAGKKIGIDITTNYPEWGVYQTVVTKSDAPCPKAMTSS
jgi:peptide/nickel transport system substrate-binding protein